MEDCRPAQAGDVAQIATLARAMRAELAPLKGGRVFLDREARGEPLEDAYQALLDADDSYLVVGSLDNVVVGFGAVEVEKLRSGATLGVITDLFVDVEARSVGVGRRSPKRWWRTAPIGDASVLTHAPAGSPSDEELLRGARLHRPALVMHHVLQPDP